MNGTPRICLDSSCWIERLVDADATVQQEAAVASFEAEGPFVVPAPVLYEVRRWSILHDHPVDVTEMICSSLEQLDVVALDGSIAANAALFSITAGLAFADATILATARHRFATLLTYDQDFAGLPDVIVLSRPTG